MKLGDLLAWEGPSIDRRGGRASVDSGMQTPGMRKAYNDIIRSLSDQPFWNAAARQRRYLAEGGLWAPQRRAIALSLAYLSARREGLADREAALIKMPTGTGKTAVIGTLACAVPEIKRTLIITPRRTLVDQMQEHLHTKTWAPFDSIYDGAHVRRRTAEEREKLFVPRRKTITRLLPSHANKLLSQSSDRMVVVGTFTALEQILRSSLSNLTPALHEARKDDDADEEGFGGVDPDVLDQLAALLRTFDLVIVDESHYEPAYVWSQCIRSLDRPTILLSATPYRNDFRYFSIKGRFVFNLGFHEACEHKLIRNVHFVTSEELGVSDFVGRLKAFGRIVDTSAAARHLSGKARTIVRAEDYKTLVQLHGLIERELKKDAILIHHRETRAGKIRRFEHVSDALKSNGALTAPYWLHQWKLLEGVDQNSFVGVALRDSLPSTRAIVQQIGRVLRYANRTQDEVAFVMTDQAIEKQTIRRFEKYLEYEAYFAQDPGEALRKEAMILDVMREAMPALQYVSGDFRNRLDFEARDFGLSDFRVPCRTTILRKTGELTLDQIAKYCAEAMGSEERQHAEVLPADPNTPHVRVIPFIQWSHSPLLQRHALPSLTFGLMVLIERGDRLFLIDTERMIIDPDDLQLEPEPIENLRKLIPATSAARPARVGQASTVSLDLSDASVRSQTSRMFDFGVGFFDLAEAMQAATAMRAYIRKSKKHPPVSRYLSLARATVSETSSEPIPLDDYIKWVAQIANALDSNVQPSAAFNRFARSAGVPSEADAQPMNVLFDFAQLIGDDAEERPASWHKNRSKELLQAEKCVAVTDGAFELSVNETTTFQGTLKYEVTGTVRRRGRYIVECEDLDTHLIASSGASGEKVKTLSAMLTKEQCFRVVPAKTTLVYAQRHFFRPSIDFAAVRDDVSGGNPLEAVVASKWLNRTGSEKGEKLSKSDWSSKSIFGGIYAHRGLGNRGEPDPALKRAISTYDSAFAGRLNEFSLIVCDDSQDEFCDFVCVDEDKRRLVLIHAKAGKSVASLNALQAVGRQALASLPFLIRTHSPGEKVDKWSGAVTSKGLRITTRLLPKAGRITPQQAWDKVREGLHSANYAREVWIVAGKILDREGLRNRLQEESVTPHDLQLLYYLAALQTSAARANVQMRIFCSAETEKRAQDQKAVKPARTTRA